MIYLLDTNVISEMIKRGDQSAALARLFRAEPGTVATSVVAAAEVWYGVEKKGSAPLREAAEGVFGYLAIMPLGGFVAPVYGRIRAALEARGTPIGPNDMLIAAHCLTLDATLVTDNEREFARVEGLRVENWLRP